MASDLLYAAAASMYVASIIKYPQSIRGGFAKAFAELHPCCLCSQSILSTYTEGILVSDGFHTIAPSYAC